MAEINSFTVKATVQLDNKQAMKSAQDVNNELDKMSKPRPAAKSAAVKAANNAYGQGETKTARAVGAGAGTGSAASDFAAQAQGLGGLVHVYATFAANIFAVSAAFNALSKAMDVTNLVKGLDQLGISSGRNLGSVAKEMVRVADGAISLQQAMTSTAMASSSGMTNQAIIRMTEVAKKASIALGRDMTDSMDRLTKGIVKTQPELLDELGIMARVIPAQQEYARAMGKSVSSLTEFEKRQAFANAVLSEGERKFGAISLNANPYSKILASTENLIQKGLELVNIVLTPLLSLLSSSPTALAVALGGVASVLLKQAIPAIGMFRENARKMADESTALANRRTKEAKDAALGQISIARKAAEDAVKVEKEILDKSLAELSKRRDTSKLGKVSTEILNKPYMSVTEDELKHLDMQAQKLEKRNKKASEGYRLAAENIAIAQLQTKELEKRTEEETKAHMKASGFLTQLSTNQRIADKANQEASVRRISNIWAENTQLTGFFQATKKGWADLKAARADSIDSEGNKIKGINNFQMVAGGISGTVKSAASGVMTLANSLGNVFAVVGIATAAFGILDSVLSKNTKTMGEYDASVTSLTESIDFLSKVQAHLWEQDSSEWLSAQSLLARANAIESVSSALETSMKKYKAAKLDANWYDDMINGVASAIGLGMEAKLGKQVNRAISESIKTIPTGAAKQEYIATIANIYGVKPEEINLDALPKATMAQMEALSAAEKKFSQSMSNTAATSMAAKDSFIGLNRSMQDLTLSITPTDPITKFGSALIDTGNKLHNLFGNVDKDTEKMGNAFQELVRLSNTPQDSGYLGEMGKDLVKDRDALQKLNSEYNTLSKSLEKQEEAYRKLKLSSVEDPNLPDTKYKARQAQRELPALEDSLNTVRKAMTALEVQKGEMVIKYAKMGVAEQEKGMDLISKKFGIEIGSAMLKVQQGIAAGISGVAGVEARGDIALKDIGLRQASNNIMIELIRAQKAATVSSELLAIQLKLQDSNLDPTERRNLNEDEKSKKQELKVINSKDPFAEYRKGAQSAEKAIAAGSEAARATAIALQEGVTKNAVLAAEAINTKLRVEVDKVTEKYAEQNRLKQQSIDIDKLSIAELTSLSAATNSTVFQNMANTKQENINQNELLKIENERKAVAEKFAIEYAAATTDKLRGQLAEGNNQKNAILNDKERLQLAANAKAEVDGRISLLAKLQSVQETTSSRENAAADRSISAKQSLIDIQGSQLDAEKELGFITESQFVAAKGLLDISKLQLTNEKEIKDAKAAQASGDRTADAEMYSAVLKVNLSTTASQADKDAMINEIVAKRNATLAENNAIFEHAINLSNARTSSEVELSKALSANKELMAQQSEQMEKMQSITENLSTAFGDIGTAIGTAAKAMVKFAHTEQKYLENKVSLQKKIDAGDTNEPETIANRIKLAKLEQKHSEDQLDGISEVAGATKKMFDEKSAAHKAFAAIERVTAAASMALKVQAMAQDMAALVPAILTGKAQLFAQGGWAGFAGVAAFMALMGQGGGGGAVTPQIPAGLTAEEMQQTQGTGTTFGDTTAKSASIQNSLDLIAETSVEGMSYYNEMVSLLTVIKDSIGNLSISLYATKGIRTGTNFGTVEATSGGGGGLLSGLFGSSSTDTSIINSGIQLQGTFMDLARAATSSAASLNQFETVQTTTTKSGALFGLFGGGSSTSITNNIKELDTSVRESIGGIFTNASQLFVAQGKKLGFTQDSVIATLESVDVNKLASLRGLKGKELEEEMNAVIGGIMDDAAKGLFPKLGQFKKFNEGFAETVTRVLDTSDKVRQTFVQLGRPLVVLEEVASKSTDTMVANIASAKAKLDKANQAVASFKPTVSEAPIGFGTVTSEIDPSLIKAQAEAERELAEARKIEAEAASGMTVRNLELTESFANAAGGLDKFLDLTASFTEKYLTLAEQVGPKIGAMQAEMTRLGVPLNTTKEQLKQLILGFDTTNPKMAQQYIDLLKLADAYDTNRNALNDLADSYGIGEDAIKGILEGAVEAASGSGEVGYSISGAILDSIKNAMYDQASSAISTVIFDTVITPMVHSMMAGTLAADLMSGAFDNAVASAASMIDNISNVFNNPELMGLLDGLSEKITGLFEKGAAALGGIKVPGTSGPSQGGTYSTGSSGTVSPLESNILDLKKAQAQLMIAENKTLEGNILLKEVQAAIEAKELEKIDASNKAMYLANKQREKEIDILKERLGLQNELNGLTDTAIEALARQRDALDESNKALFDQIQALKGAKALLLAQISSTELFTPVETLTLKIKELAEQAVAAGAGSGIDELIASFSSMGISDVKELAQSILAMTDISDAMKASFLGILNTLAGLKKAEEDRIKSLQNALESTRQSIAQAYDSFVQAEKTARENITAGYLSAQERVKSAQEAVNAELERNSEELRGFATNIREFLLELATTDLGGRSKASQYRSLQEDYAKTYALAMTGDKEALGSITNKASELLAAGKEQSSTSLEYAVLAGEIGGNLEALATLTDGKAGPLAQAVDPMVALQKELLEATEDMEKWTEAASVSGAATQKATKDYLAEWRLAQAQLSEAEFLVKQHGINIKLNTTMDSFKTLIEDYGKIKIDLASALAAFVTAVSLFPRTPPGYNGGGATIPPGEKPPGTITPGTGGGDPHIFIGSGRYSGAIDSQGVKSLTEKMASFAVGTNYVPKDMIAQIHEGEAIVPKKYNPAANGDTNQQELIQEIRLLRQEVSELKQATNNTATYSKKTSDTLTRVTLGGEAMQTQVA